MSDALKQIWEKVDQMIGPQRMETEAEHIARDMREGRFPERSDPIQVPVSGPAAIARHLAPTLAHLVPEHCTGTALAFEPGTLHIHKDGSGYIAIDEKHFECEDDRTGEGGSVHWITRLDASEMIALRDFLINGTLRADLVPQIAPGDDLVAQAEAAMEGVTGGPWRVDGEPWNQIVWSAADNRVCFMAHSNGLDDDRDVATARFIAFARQWVPEAAARLSVLTAQVAELQALVSASEAHRYKSGGELLSRAEAAEAETATLRDRLARMEGALEMAGIGLSWAQEHLRDTGKTSITVDAAARFVAEARAALTDGGSNG